MELESPMVSLEGMTAEDVIHIVEKWKEAVVGPDRMVYEDAKKEFSNWLP